MRTLKGYDSDITHYSDHSSLDLIKRHLHELDLIYRTSIVSFCSKDRQYSHVCINETLGTIDGKPVEEDKGKNIYEVIPEITSSFKLTGSLFSYSFSSQTFLHAKKPILQIL
jgi:hypothetical protein